MKMSFRHVRSRIAVYMVTVLAATLFICWIMMYSYFRDTLRQQVIEDNYNTILQIAAKIDNDYEYVVNYASIIAYNESICENLEQYNNSAGFQKFSCQMAINNTISNYRVLGKDVIASLYVVDRDSSYTVAPSGVYDETIQQDWYKDFFAVKNGLGVSAIHESTNYYFTHEKIETFSYIIPFVKYDLSFKVLGYLVVDFSLESILEQIINVENQYFIADEQLFYSNTEEIGLKNLNLTEDVTYYEGKYYLKVYMPSFQKNFVGIIEEKTIDESANGALGIVVITFLAGGLLALVLVVYLSKTITKPVSRLTEGMKKSVESGFSAELEVTGRDELTELTEIFNTMQSDIKALIAQNEESHKKERELQFKYYMSKINPHFVYNSLNCVIYLVRKQQYQDIIAFIRSLISILKRNVATADTSVTIKEEEEYLLHYFDILKYQYNDTISLALNISEELEYLRIAPMILYPLVENSVFHGIAPLGREGLAQVRMDEEDGVVRFCVSDNGVGMAEERLKEIVEYIEDSGPANFYGNIGLKNVSDRLKLLYHSCSGLKFASEREGGTTITFAIAKEELR